MRTIVVVAAALASILAVPKVSYTQTVPTVTVGQAFQVLADHDGANTAGFRLYLDGVKVGTDLPVSINAGVFSANVPAQTVRGDHTLVLGAFNADGEARSDPLVFKVVLPSPVKPGNLRLVIVATTTADGKITLELQEILEAK